MIVFVGFGALCEEVGASEFGVYPGSCIIVFGWLQGFVVFRFCCFCGLGPGLCVIVFVGCEALCEEVCA